MTFKYRRVMSIRPHSISHQENVYAKMPMCLIDTEQVPQNSKVKTRCSCCIKHSTTCTELFFGSRLVAQSIQGGIIDESN